MTDKEDVTEKGPPLPEDFPPDLSTTPEPYSINRCRDRSWSAPKFWMVVRRIGSKVNILPVTMSSTEDGSWNEINDRMRLLFIESVTWNQLKSMGYSVRRFLVVDVEEAQKTEAIFCYEAAQHWASRNGGMNDVPHEQLSTMLQGLRNADTNDSMEKALNRLNSFFLSEVARKDKKITGNS